MDKNPLVSIIIPVYKVEKYIHECINSVINQTYKNLEIILVDDYSPDLCPQICDDYSKKDSRIKVIHKTHNSGISVARNTGFEICSGEYVYFLDSDDYIERDAIDTLVSEAKYHSADVVFFDFKRIRDTNKKKYLPDCFIRKGQYTNPLKGIDMLCKLLKKKEYKPMVWLLFIRKDLLIMNKISFFPGILHEDELFTFNLFLFGNRVVHLPELLINHRIRENSIMTSSIGPQNFISMVKIASEMINIYLTQVKTEGSKNIVKKHISIFLTSIENRYFCVPFKERISLYKKYRELINKLESNDYIDSLEIREKCLKLSVVDLKREIKKILPKKAKDVIKKVLFEKDIPYSKQILSSLKETSGNKRIILIGTPIHGNLGDHAIAIAERQLFNKYLKRFEVIEIIMPVYSSKAKKIKRFISEEDIIIISGGGWLGNLWQHNEEALRSVIKNYPNNKILIMPQTIYFDKSEKGLAEKKKSKKIYASHKNLLICLRDLKSYKFVVNNKFTQNQNKCFYIPDAALTLNYKIKNKNRNGALLCFRNDRENIIDFRDRRKIRDLLRDMGLKTEYTTNVCLHHVLLEERDISVEAKLKEYASSQIVVTDRLHGMIFAAITCTPCISFDNITGKVQGVYDWIKNLEYIKFVSSIDEATSVLPSLLNKEPGEYDNTEIKKHFKNILFNLK